MNIHQRISEQADLAKVYLEDGAPHSAARVLQELAAEVSQHAHDSDAIIRALLGEDPINLAGSGPVPIEPREG